jgi:hypothetical protein
VLVFHIHLVEETLIVNKEECEYDRANVKEA